MNIPRGLAVLALVIGLVSCAVEGPVPPGPGPYWYDYYYYPSVGVYFNIRSGYYYYHSDGRWVRTTVLPPIIRLDPRDRHRFESREPEPFHRNKEYRERYKPIPDFKPNRDHDRQERDFNRRSHEQYRDQRKPDGGKRHDEQRRDRDYR